MKTAFYIISILYMIGLVFLAGYVTYSKYRLPRLFGFAVTIFSAVLLLIFIFVIVIPENIPWSKVIVPLR